MQITAFDQGCLRGDGTNTFNEELRVLVESAHMYGVKVAAHATNGETIAKLLRLGVGSIEHGYNSILFRSSTNGDTGTDTDSHPDPADDADPNHTRRVLRALARSKTKWVPTLATNYTLSQSSGNTGPWARAAEAFKAALENIACARDGVDGAFGSGLAQGAEVWV